MPRGRPAASQIRQNIVEILHFAGKMHGYSLYSAYKELFPKVTMRSIYYHLKKGLETGEFRVAEVRKEKGSYSWGAEVERTYYSLGQSAKPRSLPIVKEYFEKKERQAAQRQTQE